MASGTKVCPKCGGENSANRLYCTLCGAALAGSEAYKREVQKQQQAASKKKSQPWGVSLLKAIGILILVFMTLLIADIIGQVILTASHVRYSYTSVYHPAFGVEETVNTDWSAFLRALPPSSLSQLAIWLPVGFCLLSGFSFLLARSLGGQGSVWQHGYRTLIALLYMALIELGFVILTGCVFTFSMMGSDFTVLRLGLWELLCFSLVVWYPLVRIALKTVASVHLVPRGRAFIAALPLFLLGITLLLVPLSIDIPQIPSGAWWVELRGSGDEWVFIATIPFHVQENGTFSGEGTFALEPTHSNSLGDAAVSMDGTIRVFGQYVESGFDFDNLALSPRSKNEFASLQAARCSSDWGMQEDAEDDIGAMRYPWPPWRENSRAEIRAQDGAEAVVTIGCGIGRTYFILHQGELPPPTTQVNLWTDATTVPAGNCTTIHWNVDGVRAVHFDGAGVPGTGTRETCPCTDETHTLDVTLRDGSHDVREITVKVTGTCNTPTP